MKKTRKSLYAQQWAPLVASVAAAAFAAGCAPVEVPPQVACPASFGGNLALHDVNSINTYPSPQWGAWGGDIHNTRHAANEMTISTANVADLEVKWAFTTNGTVRTNPTVEGDIVYFPDAGPGIDATSNFAGSTLWALNRHTADVVWQKQMRYYNDNDFGNMVNTSPAIAGDLIIIGDYANPAPMSTLTVLTTHAGRFNYGYDDPCAGYVTAIKRDGVNAGERVWSTRIGEDDFAMANQSAVVHDETVFVGLSSQESTYGRIASFTEFHHRGKLAALDLHTGALLWQTYLTPPQFGGVQGFSGVSAWGGMPTIDETRNLVYVPTGNNYSVPQAFEDCMVLAGTDLSAQAICGATHSVMDNYVDSIVALNMDTGVVEWSFRATDYDPWNTACDFEFVMPIVIAFSSDVNCADVKGPDADFAQPPMLYTTDVGGSPKQLLAAGTKGGEYFILDPDAASEATRVVFGAQVGPGGKIGGFEFGSATDGERLYVANANFDHTPYTLVAGSPGHAGQTIYGGFWAALDAETGATLWETPVPNVPMSVADLSGGIFHLVFAAGRGAKFFSWNFSPLTVANGVVYASVSDWSGSYVALDAATGEILWLYENEDGIGSVSAPTIVDGNLYWGNGSKYSAPGGSTLYNFGLPD